jgi:hypothetical protein
MNIYIYIYIYAWKWGIDKTTACMFNVFEGELASLTSKYSIGLSPYAHVCMSVCMYTFMCLSAVKWLRLCV